ncbi:MAG: MBL fold metallo-hydrolase [Brachymonas sp.]|nr:MBL fold metallo-hydrolase [Brachymonas sp.]
MSLRFKNLGSGSTGNATLIASFDGVRHRYLLVDCGMPLRRLTARLQQAGVEPDQLQAVFITHEHDDHIGCAEQLVLRYRIPALMSRGTYMALGQPDWNGLYQPVRDGDVLDVAGMQLQPFTVPHDAREPLQLRCTDGDRVLGIATDLGHATPHVIRHLQHCHALVLESNHDPDMLAASTYPAFLKRRVAGQEGHLSNGAAAELLATLQHGALGHVVAAHLSLQNNRPELAAQSLAAALARQPDELAVACAKEGCAWLTV